MPVASCPSIFTLRQIRLFKFEVVVTIIITPIIIIMLVRTLKLASNCQVSTYVNKEVNFFNGSAAFELYKILEGEKTFLECTNP